MEEVELTEASNGSSSDTRGFHSEWVDLIRVALDSLNTGRRHHLDRLINQYLHLLTSPVVTTLRRLRKSSHPKCSPVITNTTQAASRARARMNSL
jgi:hypothetical protein